MIEVITEFDDGAIRKALSALGEQLGPGEALELLVIGGAAGILTGVLGGAITTSDLDVVFARPAREVETILEASQDVADQQGIARGWLNLNAGLFANAIPDDWATRRVDIGQFGRLRVFALGRQDLIAMKFYAHRDVDLEHLAQIKVTAEELSAVKKYLRQLARKLPFEMSRLKMALMYVKGWK